MPEITRRNLFEGLAAAMISRALPPIHKWSLKGLGDPKRITLRIPMENGLLTRQFFMNVLNDISDQVNIFARHGLFYSEQLAMAKDIEEILFSIKPVGVVYDIRAPVLALLHGAFEVSESRPGVIQIS